MVTFCAPDSTLAMVSLDTPTAFPNSTWDNPASTRNCFSVSWIGMFFCPFQSLAGRAGRLDICLDCYPGFTLHAYWLMTSTSASTSSSASATQFRDQNFCVWFNYFFLICIVVFQFDAPLDQQKRYRNLSVHRQTGFPGHHLQVIAWIKCQACIDGFFDNGVFMLPPCFPPSKIINLSITPSIIRTNNNYFYLLCGNCLQSTPSDVNICSWNKLTPPSN